MLIAPIAAADLDAWSAMRAALWPDDGTAAHRAEAASALAAADPDALTLICRSPDGAAAGFAEATIRHDYVNGCDTSPVVFLEGIYVDPAFRGHGIARGLCDRVAGWGRSHGCREFASDALAGNLDSHAFHAAIGFVETERVVFFRRML